jgi:adenine-specific DNA-methyltransferase
MVRRDTIDDNIGIKKKMTEQTQPEKFDLRSLDVAAEQREKLRQLFPEVITEGGKVDFDRLKSTLGEVVDSGKERYGMNWPGKAECFRTIQTPSRATLRPCVEESYPPKPFFIHRFTQTDADLGEVEKAKSSQVQKEICENLCESVDGNSSENLIIEGDNLEVLKLLQKGYLGKVKMIYIDPPYNTGNEFIYPDNFTESLETYLQYTGQVDAAGRKFSSNPETSGRYHSNWLNMMYPRLFLARNLLRDDGVIFISIDDHEVDNLRKLCNEIFGEENFVGMFVWKRRASSALAERLVSTDHEYVLAFQKSGFVSLGSPKDFENYSNSDGDIRGEWVTGDLTVGMGKDLRPNQFYPITDPVTGKTYQPNPNRVWAYIPESMNKMISEERILFPEDISRRPMLKRFKSELRSEVNPVSTWASEVGLNTAATREIQEMFGSAAFSYSKPTSLLNFLTKTTADKNDLILDFFAGSGTTAQAVLELNAADGGNRKFILVQLPEPTGREDYPTIAEITKERVRRVIYRLTQKDADLEKESKQPENEPNLFPKEICENLRESADKTPGFKVFKLDTSNFKPWDGTPPATPDGLTAQLELHVDHILTGRTQEDILTELLLKSGFPLTTAVERKPFSREDAKDAKFCFSVEGGAMLICLEPELTQEMLKEMAEMKPTRVICLDAGFQGNDQLKTNAVQTMKARGVVKFQTV